MAASQSAEAARRGKARQMAALNRAALAIADDLDIDRVLTRILATARSLVRARYGALGVPDGRGGYDRFLTVGFSDALARRIGDLPRFHGVLGILVRDGKPIRMRDIRDHPEFGWYPEHHPVLKEFLGVPVRHRGETVGELYLSGTASGRFTAADQEIVEMLASHAGIAIATARLYQRAQELAVLEERERVARELHDAVSQTLFSMVYEARAASDRAASEPAMAREALMHLEEQASSALSEMRGLVYALRPKSLERDGLAATLADHVDALHRSHGVAIELLVEASPELALDEEVALLRIAQEALQNTLKHAAGSGSKVSLRRTRAGTELSVRDAGGGFDIEQLPRTVRTMGLSTMRDRAAAIGASLDITSAPGEGTEIRVFLPSGRPRA